MGTVTCEVGAAISLGGPAQHGERRFQSGGLRCGPPEVMSRLAGLAGCQDVPPKNNVSRTLVRQTTGDTQWLHLNKVMALAVGRREPTRVMLDFWRVG